MDRLRLPAVALLGLALLGGCHRPAKAGGRAPEMIVQDAVASLRAAADAMDRAQDDQSAQASASTLRAEAVRLTARRGELARVGRPSAQEKERVGAHTQEVIDGSNRVQQAVTRLTAAAQGGRIGRDAAARVLDATQEYGRATVAFGEQLKPFSE